jgi:hypothetical protein
MDSLSGTKVSVLVEDTKDGAKSRFNDTGDGGETEIGFNKACSIIGKCKA